MLKLRSIGLSDYSVLEGRQPIGRICLATEHIPRVWLWSINVHLPGGLPMGSANENIRHTSLGGPRFQRSESPYPSMAVLQNLNAAMAVASEAGGLQYPVSSHRRRVMYFEPGGVFVHSKVHQPLSEHARIQLVAQKEQD